MYNGNCGPGTLEMTRFQVGRPGREVEKPKVSRAARAKTAGGMKLLASCNSSAGLSRGGSLISATASGGLAAGATLNLGRRLVRMAQPRGRVGHVGVQRRGYQQDPVPVGTELLAG